MGKTFDDVFIFLIELAWKSRFAIPVIVTTFFLATGMSLQIDLNFGTHQEDHDDMEDSEVASEAPESSVSINDEPYNDSDADTQSTTSTTTTDSSSAFTNISRLSDLEDITSDEYSTTSFDSSDDDDASVSLSPII